MTFVLNDNKNLAGKDSAKTPNIGSIKDFLAGAGKWKSMEVSRPFLNFSIAAPLKVGDKQTVDTIEYQIIYTLKNPEKYPPLVTNPTVSSQGFSQGYGTAMEASVSKQTGVYSYGLVGE